MTVPSNHRGRLVSFALGVLATFLALPAFVAPVGAVSDNTNLIQQILTVVLRVETAVLGLAGAGGEVADLQSDVTAIKTKTDNLPDDTSSALNEIRANTGSGPMNRMFMHSFTVGTGQIGSVTCTSSGPYLAHVHARGINADVVGYVNGVEVTGILLPVPTSLTLGGNVGDALTIELRVSSETNPNSFGFALITIQTTEGAVIGCN